MPLPKNLSDLIGLSPEETTKELTTIPQIEFAPGEQIPTIPGRPSIPARFGLRALEFGGLLRNKQIPEPETKSELITDIIGDMIGTAPAFIGSGGVATSLIKGVTIGGRIARAASTGAIAGGLTGGGEALLGGKDAGEVLTSAVSRAGLDAAAMTAFDLGLIGVGKFYRKLSSSITAKRNISQNAERTTENIIPEIRLAKEAEQGAQDESVIRMMEQIQRTGKIPEELSFPRIRQETTPFEVPPEIQDLANKSSATVSKNGSIRFNFASKEDDAKFRAYLQSVSGGKHNVEKMLKTQLVDSRQKYLQDLEASKEVSAQARTTPTSPEVGAPAPALTAPPVAEAPIDLPIFSPKLSTKPPVELVDNFNFKKGAIFKFFDDRYPSGVSGQTFEVESIYYPILDPKDLKTLTAKVKDPNTFLQLRRGFVRVINENGNRYDVPFDEFVRSVARQEKFPIDKETLTPAMYENFRAFTAERTALGEETVDVVTGEPLKRARIRSLYDVLEEKVIPETDEPITVMIGKRKPKQVTFVPGSLFRRIGQAKDEILNVEWKLARSDLESAERKQLLDRKRILNKKRFALLNMIDQIKEPLSDFDKKLMQADIQAFFTATSKRPASTPPIRVDPPLTTLPPALRAKLHPAMRELDDGIINARTKLPLQYDLSAENHDFLTKYFLGISGEDLQVATDMGMLTDLKSILAATGDTNTASGFRSKFGIVAHMNLQNIRPPEIKDAEEALVMTVKSRIIDKGLSVPDDMTVVMRNFSGSEVLFATRPPDFLVKIKKSESPIDYIANQLEKPSGYGNITEEAQTSIVEKTTNVSTLSDKILANQVLKQFKTMDIMEIPPGTTFYGRKGKGAKHQFVGPDQSNPNRVMLMDPNEDLVSVQIDTFKRNYSPLTFCD